MRYPWTLMVLAALAVAACDDAIDTAGHETAAPAEVGVLQLPLIATSASGTDYRLRAVQFRIEQPGMDPVVLNGNPAVPFVQADLPPGGYTVTLVGNWILEAADGEGGWDRVDAVLQSPNPLAVEVTVGGIAEAFFRFGVGDDAVAFGQGKVRVGFEVDDGGCVDGLTACDGACVDTDSDAGHCGGCDQACDPGIACQEGACVTERLVFVSSAVLDADLGGVEGADAACQALADAAELPGTYRAWLSSTTQGVGVLDRFVPHAVPYVLTDGTALASDFADVIDGELASPIDVTEYGTAPAPYDGEILCHGGETCTFVFTGTRPDGTTYDGQHPDCDGWSTTTFLPAFTGGDFANLDSPSNWTYRAIGLRCDYRARLYCFQQ